MDHPLVSSTRRLVTALDRLERNLKDGGSQKKGQSELFERENAALRVEHDKLNAAISDLKTRYDDLQKVASTIYTKLEESIKRLTQIIDN